MARNLAAPSQLGEGTGLPFAHQIVQLDRQRHQFANPRNSCRVGFRGPADSGANRYRDRGLDSFAVLQQDQQRADSLSRRKFLSYGLEEATPDHVTISRTRRLLDEETHQAVFTFVLTEVARRGLLKGKTIGIDATTLEANAAMRSIVRRDTGESYLEYLRKLAKEAGIDPNDDDAVRRMDRKRKKKTANEEWVNPHDPDAEVTKMKDGTTHLAYKAEQAVDLDTGVIVAITTHGGATGDSESVRETLPAAGYAVAEQIDTPTAQGSYRVNEQGLCEVVADKGYHSGAGLAEMSQSVRTYVSVPQQPRRNWKGKAEQQ